MQSLAGEMLKTCAALMLCPQFWLATSVSSLLFLLEQNTEVLALFSSCEIECLLSVDCMQFIERKLQATCVKGLNSHLTFLIKKPAYTRLTIQGSMEAHYLNGNKQTSLSFLPTGKKCKTRSHRVTVSVSIACMVSAKHFLVPLM